MKLRFTSFICWFSEFVPSIANRLRRCCGVCSTQRANLEQQLVHVTRHLQQKLKLKELLIKHRRKKYAGATQRETIPYPRTQCAQRGWHSHFTMCTHFVNQSVPTFHETQSNSYLFLSGGKIRCIKRAFRWNHQDR